MAEGAGVKEFVKDAALAAAASAAADFFVEVAGIPMLNYPSPIVLPPEHEQTVVETILYGGGLILTTLGGLSLFAGKPIFGGYGKQALAYGVGILAGTSFYEHQV